MKANPRPVHPVFSGITLVPCALAVLLGIFLAGCTEGKSKKIIIRGSNTFGEELAPRLIAEFKQTHPGVEFDTEFKGTSYGLGALMVGKCDIAAASREVTTNELALSPIPNIELKGSVVGSYAVAVVVNSNNPLAGLSVAQVRDIFTGAVQNWREVGGADAAIHLYIRNPISGTYLGFQELAMDKQPYGTHLKSFTDYKSIIEAVAADPGGIGYSDFEPVKAGGAKALSIGGVAPTAEAVNQGKYPYARVLRLYTDRAAALTDAGTFVEFVQSAPAQKILAESGYVPKP